jgi:hypothetical protein
VGVTETCLRRGIGRHSRRHTRHAGGAGRSHKVEFSFLNGNLIAPASQPSIFNCDTFLIMEEHMSGESTQILLFLAIVGLTVVSTIDLVMQPIKQGKSAKQGKSTDQEH